MAGANAIILTFVHTPPGVIGNQLILPLAALMLVLPLRSYSESRNATSGLVLPELK